MAKKQVVHKMAKRTSKKGSFGPVSAINTAPVSVGNSVRGASPSVTQTSDGARVVSRDFAFALASTPAAVTGWEMIGAMPITPAVLPSSILRNYCQMFNKFKVNSFRVHYITSSPTSQAGDVMLYYEKDRFSPMVDYSNSSFLPYVLSDPNTVIGPQWTNHSVTLRPTRDWKTTLYGNQTDLNEDAEGTLFFFSKTNAANSPGYLLIDYDIQFKELSVNPRAGSLPIARGQATFVGLNSTTNSITAGTAATWVWSSVKNITGAISAAPTGAIPGDIYKCVIQYTGTIPAGNTTWSGSVTPTNTNMLQYGSTNRALIIDDGLTLYLAWNSASALNLFTSLEAAVTNSWIDAVEWQTTISSLVFSLCAEIHLVRNVTDLTQSSY